MCAWYAKFNTVPNTRTQLVSTRVNTKSTLVQSANLSCTLLMNKKKCFIREPIPGHSLYVSKSNTKSTQPMQTFCPVYRWIIIIRALQSLDIHPEGEKAKKKNQNKEGSSKMRERLLRTFGSMYVQCLKDNVSLLFGKLSPVPPTHPRLRSHCSNSFKKNTIWELETKQKSLSERVAFRKINQAHHLSFQKF
jgi:hypothetical protein